MTLTFYFKNKVVDFRSNDQIIVESFAAMSSQIVLKPRENNLIGIKIEGYGLPVVISKAIAHFSDGKKEIIFPLEGEILNNEVKYITFSQDYNNITHLKITHYKNKFQLESGGLKISSINSLKSNDVQKPKAFQAAL